MKFISSAGMLKSALKTLALVVPRRSTIPILQTVMFDGRSLTACDCDMSITVQVPATEAKGKACLSHRALTAIVAYLPPDEQVTISSDAESATITFGASRYQLPMAAADDFPVLNLQEPAGMDIDGAALKKAVGFVAPYVSTEDTRYYLNGLAFSGDCVVATDGHRLAMHPVDLDAAGVLSGAILPNPAVSALLKLPPARRLEISTTGRKRMRFDMGGAVMIATLIDGTFPDWNRVVPAFDDHASRFTIDAATLLPVLRRMVAIAPNFSRDATLQWGNGGLALARVADEFTSCEYLPLSFTGAEGWVNLWIPYLIRVLSSLQHGEIRATIATTSGSPSRWEGDSGAFILLMPRRGDSAVAKLTAEVLEKQATTALEAAE